MRKMFLKIFVVPAWVLLCLISRVFDLGLKIYSFGAGVVFILLFLGLLISVVNCQWFNAGILLGIAMAIIMMTAFIVFGGVIIGIWKDKITSLLVA